MEISSQLPCPRKGSNFQQKHLMSAAETIWQSVSIPEYSQFILMKKTWPSEILSRAES